MILAEEASGAMRVKNANPSTTPADPAQPVSWISKTPGVCGGDACIRGTRATVWGLVEWRQLGLSDTEILRHVPDLSQDDLHVAWEYYEKHRDEIDQAIREDQDA